MMTLTTCVHTQMLSSQAGVESVLLRPQACAKGLQRQRQAGQGDVPIRARAANEAATSFARMNEGVRRASWNEGKV